MTLHPNPAASRRREQRQKAQHESRSPATRASLEVEEQAIEVSPVRLAVDRGRSHAPERA
jgi:hypothetical protein